MERYLSHFQVFTIINNAISNLIHYLCIPLYMFVLCSPCFLSSTILDPEHIMVQISLWLSFCLIRGIGIIQKITLAYIITKRDKWLVRKEQDHKETSQKNLKLWGGGRHMQRPVQRKHGRSTEAKDQLAGPQKHWWRWFSAPLYESFSHTFT